LFGTITHAHAPGNDKGVLVRLFVALAREMYVAGSLKVEHV
jgi:hypothetical protein